MKRSILFSALFAILLISTTYGQVTKWTQDDTLVIEKVLMVYQIVTSDSGDTILVYSPVQFLSAAILDSLISDSLFANFISSYTEDTLQFLKPVQFTKAAIFDTTFIKYTQKDSTDTLVFLGALEVPRIRATGEYWYFGNYPQDNLLIEADNLIIKPQDSSNVQLFLGEDIGTYSATDNWTLIKIKELLDGYVPAGQSAKGLDIYYNAVGTNLDTVKGDLYGVYVIAGTVFDDAYVDEAWGGYFYAQENAGKIRIATGVEGIALYADTNYGVRGVSSGGDDDYALILGRGSNSDEGHAFIEGAIKFEVHSPTAKDSSGGLYLDSTLSTLTWVDGSNNFYTILLSDYSGGSFLDFPDSVRKWISDSINVADSSWNRIRVDTLRGKAFERIEVVGTFVAQDTVSFTDYFQTNSVDFQGGALSGYEVEGTVTYDVIGTGHLMAYVNPAGGGAHWIELTDTTYAQGVASDTLLQGLQSGDQDSLNLGNEFIKQKDGKIVIGTNRMVIEANGDVKLSDGAISIDESDSSVTFLGNTKFERTATSNIEAIRIDNNNTSGYGSRITYYMDAQENTIMLSNWDATYNDWRLLFGVRNGGATDTILTLANGNAYITDYDSLASFDDISVVHSLGIAGDLEVLGDVYSERLNNAISDSTQDAPRDTVFLQDADASDIVKSYFEQTDSSYNFNSGRGAVNIAGGTKDVYLYFHKDAVFDTVDISDEQVDATRNKLDITNHRWVNAARDTSINCIEVKSPDSSNVQYYYAIFDWVLPEDFHSWVVGDTIFTIELRRGSGNTFKSIVFRNTSGDVDSVNYSGESYDVINTWEWEANEVGNGAKSMNSINWNPGDKMVFRAVISGTNNPTTGIGYYSWVRLRYNRK